MVTENHAIYKNNHYTSLENNTVEPVESVHRNIYSIIPVNTYKVILSYIPIMS